MSAIHHEVPQAQGENSRLITQTHNELIRYHLSG
jgi:hypothetical protein